MVKVVVGRSDPSGLFQPEQSCDSIRVVTSRNSCNSSVLLSPCCSFYLGRSAAFRADHGTCLLCFLFQELKPKAPSNKTKDEIKPATALRASIRDDLIGGS